MEASGHTQLPESDFVDNGASLDVSISDAQVQGPPRSSSAAAGRWLYVAAADPQQRLTADSDHPSGALDAAGLAEAEAGGTAQEGRLLLAGRLAAGTTAASPDPGAQRQQSHHQQQQDQQQEQGQQQEQEQEQGQQRHAQAWEIHQLLSRLGDTIEDGTISSASSYADSEAEEEEEGSWRAGDAEALLGFGSIEDEEWEEGEEEGGSGSWEGLGWGDEELGSGRGAEGEPGEQQQQVSLDVEEVARHSYLGDTDDLGGGGAWLQEGSCVVLPVLCLPQVVLLPGQALPLKLLRHDHRRLVQRALQAPAPLHGLLAVISHSGALFCSTGCSAEVRAMRQHHDGALHVRTVGRQRLSVDLSALASGGDVAALPCRVLADGPPGGAPREALQDLAHCPAWAWAAAAWDVRRLAAEVMQLTAAVLPAASSFRGSPLQLSYWVAANLPLGQAQRQRLLEAGCAAQRLRQEAALLRELGQLCCAGCGAPLAQAADAIRLTPEGSGGAFVNTHGYVHDMMTFARLHPGSVGYQGGPQTEHSWFPGYAWTICNCRRCLSHLGWRFTACRPGLAPGAFWGVRRPLLAAAAADSE